MKIKILMCDSRAVIPTRAHEGDAGIDFYSPKEDRLLSKIVWPGERISIKTGIKMEIPLGYAGLIWDKSGKAIKEGLKVMGGVVDSGYRGEIIICLVNTGKEAVSIMPGDKIAQMLIQKVECPELTVVDELSETARGENGFGSTGE